MSESIKMVAILFAAVAYLGAAGIGGYIIGARTAKPCPTSFISVSIDEARQ